MLWKMTTPMRAPMGSTEMLSQPSTVTRRRPGRELSSRGVTTVGPETMRIAPSMTAARELRPRKSVASTPAAAHVIGIPRYSRRRTTRRPWPSRSRKTRSSPPSKRMMATARLTMGPKASPKSRWGLIVLVRAPAAKPTGSSRTMAGMRSFDAAS
jgi:hypothetical protein